ncbi:MAG TPA: metal ABC transporter permease [Fibrobacteraceae bacterium]|nr:metal ABC transporter permease [Fibrobacteraceae bacterium]
MKHALLAVLLLMPVLGLAGTAVVHHRMAFFSDALGHGAFTGVAIGSLVGLAHPQISSLLFALLFAVLVTWVQHSTRMGRDTVIGALASLCVAIGVFLATWNGRSIGRLANFLVGDLLSVAPQDLGIALILALLFFPIWVFLGNRLLLLGCSSSLAISRGIRPLWLEMTFAGLLAVVVTFSLQWLGLLTVNACLVLPAATGRLLARSARSHAYWSIGLATFCGLVGLLASWYADSVAGASIVMALAVAFFIALFLAKWRR